MYCLETNNLMHAFSSKEIVLNNINIKVEEGSIYGFLGPNGAGKTTTLRLILGLIKKQQGSIFVFGKPFDKNRVKSLTKIGSIIEMPSVYGHLTAIENLKVLQKIYQCPEQRMQEVLNLVGLQNTGNKKANQFSLGMKQRLGIAIALLNDPTLLILDEPTNGLDPNGMLEIRELLRKLNKEKGITIVISSHLLSEIEKLVSHVGIINKGCLVFQGTLQELMDKQNNASVIILDTSDNEKTIQFLNNQNIIAGIENGKIIMPLISKEKIAKLNDLLIQHQLDVYEISTIKKDLETIFMDMITNKNEA